MTIKDIAKDEAKKYAIKEICGNCNNCQSKGYIGCDTYRYGKNAFEVAFMLGYNRGRAEELSKGDYE